MTTWRSSASSRVRIAALIAVALMGAGALVTAPVAPARAADYPGQDEIEAARAAAAGAAASVSQLDAAIAQLEDALHQTDVAARLADEDYHQAQELNIAAQRRKHEAAERADEAEAALAVARRALASVAMTSYRNAGSMGQFEAITKADGFDDVIQRSEAIGRASVDADNRLEEVRAAELVAATTRAYAEKAADDADAAELAAQDALEVAKQARSDAERAVRDAAAARTDAINRLAELRGVTAELEQQRQEGLADERRARERAAFEETQRQAEEQAPPSSNPGNGNGGGNSGGNNGGGNSGGGNGNGGGSTPPPTNNPDPTPTETPDPQPEPEPEPTQPPPTTPPPAAWKSSASQGQTAANHSLTLRGAPYVWGGNGPGYDCSGLTSASWSRAGIGIPRTSRAQYTGTVKLPYSDLRPGDLVFWGSGRNASAIYHVAIYIGNGQVMEAQTYGKPAAVRSMYNWAVGDMMPYIGRP